MAILYANNPGTEITTSIVNGTLGDQSQANGVDELVMDNVLTSATNYQSNAGTNTTYVNRLVLLRRGGVEETKLVVAETAGTGTTRILTVHEPWTTAPTSGDNIDFAYTLDDIENGGAGGGVTFNTRTGFYEFSNRLYIGQGTNFAYLQAAFGEFLEVEDSSSTTDFSFRVFNNARFDCGYLAGTTPINGAFISGVNPVDGETWVTWLAGALGEINDTTFISLRASLQFSVIDSGASDIKFRGCKLIRGLREADIPGLFLDNFSVVGASSASDITRLNENTTWTTGVVSNSNGLDTLSGDTSTETITVRDLIFTGNLNDLTVQSNKRWNVINPSWTVTALSDITWGGTTSAFVYDQRSVDAQIIDPQTNPIANALVNIYEETTDNLETKLVSNSEGFVSGTFDYKLYANNSTTTTFTNHALQVGAWTYSPFVSTQSSTAKFDGVVTLTLDSNIIDTDQANVLTTGSGITWNVEANPTSIIDFSSATGTLSVGDTVTGGTSGADGVVTEFLEGSGTDAAGVIHLRSRDGLNFTDGETITATSWSGTYVAGSQQDFSVYVDGAGKSLQTIYEYLNALQTETTLSATGEQIWEWARDGQGQALQTNGTTFFTRRSRAKGVIVIDRGAGDISFFTDDAGGTYVPPANYTITFTGLQANTEVRLYNADNNVPLAGEEDITSGSFAYTYTYGGTDVNAFAAVLSLSYENLKINNLVLSNQSQSIPVQQRFDRNYENP